MNTETIATPPNAWRGILRAVTTGLSAYFTAMGVLFVFGGLADWHGVLPSDMTFSRFWGAVAPSVGPLVIVVVVVRWVVAGRGAQ